IIEECSDVCIDGSCQGIECNNDLDCDDDNDLTVDMCINPGTVGSRCEHEMIQCAKESDCGIDGFIGVNICDENDVVRRFIDYKCNNPGKDNSFCSSAESLDVVESCTDACVEGQCIDFVCENNEECFDGNPNTDDVCINPSTIDAFCHHGFVACHNDGDCGVNIFIGDVYCVADDITQNFLDYKCVNPGEANSYCTLTSKPTFRESCENACINAGICVPCDEDLDCDDGNIETLDRCEFPGHFFARCVNLVPICEVDSDCGEDRDVDEFFCIGDNVYVNHLSFSCLEAGTLSSSCTSETSERLVQECAFGCNNGECVPPRHDVAFDTGLSGSINGIRLEETNGTDILEDPAGLISGMSYKVVVDVENEGNFFENVTFDGEVRDNNDNLVLEFVHNPKDNLEPGESSLKTKTVEFLLNDGFYNLSVEAIIPIDQDIVDNKVIRTIHITSAPTTTTTTTTSTTSSSSSSSTTSTSTSSTSSTSSSSSTTTSSSTSSSTSSTSTSLSTSSSTSSSTSTSTSTTSSSTSSTSTSLSTSSST
ncbi:MAG: hypothetical protein AABW46_03400, partial [Nanoarchaeota archaeon]